MDAGTSAIRGGSVWRTRVSRAELTQCAHRNRPLRYDGRMVVTLCADDVLYLPVTTEISSLPQLTPEGLPLALARRAAEDRRMANAVAKLEARRGRDRSGSGRDHAHLTDHRVRLAAKARNGHV